MILGAGEVEMLGKRNAMMGEKIEGEDVKMLEAQ